MQHHLIHLLQYHIYQCHKSYHPCSINMSRPSGARNRFLRRRIRPRVINSTTQTSSIPCIRIRDSVSQTLFHLHLLPAAQQSTHLTNNYPNTGSMISAFQTLISTTIGSTYRVFLIEDYSRCVAAARVEMTDILNILIYLPMLPQSHATCHCRGCRGTRRSPRPTPPTPRHYNKSKTLYRQCTSS